MKEEKQQHGPAEMRSLAEPNQKRKKNVPNAQLWNIFKGNR